MATKRYRSDGSVELRGAVPCPPCGKADNTEINLRSRKWICWRCMSGGVLEDGALLPDPKDLKRVRKWRDGERTSLPEQAKAECRRRGLSAEWVETRYRVKWDGERMIWPAGSGFCARSVYPGDEPKTRTIPPRGLIGQHLLGTGQDVVLVEGDFKAAAVPLPWVGLGTQGMHLSYEQAERIEEARPRSVTFAWDGGTDTFMRKAATKLLALCPLRMLRLPHGAGPDDVPRGELVSLLLAAEKESR